MKELLEKLSKDGYFLDTVATAFGQSLAEEKIKDKEDWYNDWSAEFFDNLNKAVKKAIKEQVDEYLKTINIKKEVAFRVSQAISEIVTNFKTENE